MQPKDALDIVAYLVGIGTTVVVVRSNIKKQTIIDLQALVEVLQDKIEVLEGDVENRDVRIQQLEETVSGYSELVREGYLSGIDRPPSRNRATATKTTKNRSA
jgi:hypothetical protein